MLVFIDFWKLETENSILDVFSFLHKLSFENSFCFLPVLSCQTSFLVSKIKNCFWKQKTRGKKQLPNIPLVFLIVFLYSHITITIYYFPSSLWYVKKEYKTKYRVNKISVNLYNYGSNFTNLHNFSQWLNQRARPKKKKKIVLG